MIKDTIAKGIIAGLLAAIVHVILNYLWFMTGLTKSTDPQLLARGILLVPSNQSLTLAQEFVGIIGHFIGGIIFIVVLVYILNLTGFDYYLLKGSGFGAVIWFFHKPTLPYFAHAIHTYSVNIALLHLTDHIIFGLTAAYIIGLLSDIHAKT
jgi:hypothetical protein